MPLAPVQRRDLWLLALLRGVSFLGDSVALITLYLRVAHGGHPWNVALLSIAAAVPIVAFAPIAGHVIDHTPAKRLLSLLCVAEALVCVAIGVWHGIGATVALMALLSCFVAFSLPGYSALVPHVAGDANITTANSMMQSVQGVAAITGPALGGLLVGVSGQSWPLYFDAMSFAVCALGTLALRTDRRPTPGTERPKRGERDLGAGLRILLRDEVLRPLMITFTIFLLALIMINVAEVFFITRTLGGSALVYGLVGTSFGVGNIIGALAAGKIREEDHPLVRASIIAIIVIGVTFGVVGLVEHVGYVFALMVVGGVAVGVVNVTATTVLTLRTPEAQRGRMFAASGAIFTSAEIGAMVLGGVLLGFVSPRTVFQIAGVVSTLSALVFGPVVLRASRRSAPRGDLAQGD